MASEINVTEAIATGILIHVTALYSYQNELDRLERRGNSIRHRCNFDVSRQYLGALHRPPEHTLGLEESLFSTWDTNYQAAWLQELLDAQGMKWE